MIESKRERQPQLTHRFPERIPAKSVVDKAGETLNRLLP
jgi:hypothetical protein